MELRTKRIYDDISDDDGLRVLVDRLWPRGLSKDRAGIDLWAKDLAPSAKARKEFGHKRENFDSFRARYLDELTHRESVGELIGQLIDEDPERITLLYAARDRKCNHALVLLEYLREQIPGSRLGDPDIG